MKTLLLFPFQLNKTYIEHLHIDFNEILVIEHLSFYKRYPYHKKRIVLHHSAILHFVDAYQNTYPVHHLLIDDLNTFYEKYNKPHTYMFLPNDQSDFNFIKPLTNVTYVDDPLFIVSRDEWKTLLLKKPWKMDTIYRKLRHKHQILMNHDFPIGDKFSFDSENRKPYKKGLHFHAPLTFDIDALTQKSIDWTNALFIDHPGNLDAFIYPVSQSQANQALKHFIDYRLSTFGDHQDVMIKNEPYMSHALISSCLNLGLLNPMDVIKAVEKAYHDGLCGIEPAEGFIRQVLGWREYIRGIYLMTPDYHEKNALNHHASLPSFYWDAKTDLSCLAHTIGETIDNSYNHHIQRLMILSNYANLIGVHPKEVNDWFNSMYVDSFDWVVTPNVMGMGLYADGGLMSTKPYISGASYIKKMSNYCEGCKYDPMIKTGDKACPFNGLYWNFINDNKDTLKSNPRMSMMVNLLDKMDIKMKENHIRNSQLHIKQLK